jgi:hypothetical protein
MSYTRLSWPIVAAALLAACSGNIGGGQSTLPGTMPSGGTGIAQIAQAAPTPTPASASNVASIGDNPAPQLLPDVAGWSGSIAFSKPVPGPSPTPNAKSTASPLPAPTGPISVGITAAVVEPSDAPALGSSAKHRGKHSPGGPQPLLFISLLATADVTLAQYPRIAVGMPREVAARHRSDLFALALYDPTVKAKAFALDVAERDLSSPIPGSLPTAMPAPSATPTSLRSPTSAPFGPTNSSYALTPPPLNSAESGLPPEYIAFKATSSTLTLKANEPAVFALYAIAPSPSPSPSPTPSASPVSHAAPKPLVSPSPLPSASPTATPTATPHPV